MRTSIRWFVAVLSLLAGGSVLGAAANISVNGVASVNSAATLSADQGASAVILAMQITNDGDEDTAVDEIELTLEADWSNESTFDPNDAFLAVRAFVDGSAAGDADGNGAFTFDGEADEELGAALSASVSLVAGTGSGNDVSDTASATVTFDVNVLELPAGETKAVYFVLEITDDDGGFDASEDETLELRLRMPSISRVSTVGEDDTFEPLDAALAGRLVRYGSLSAGPTATSPLIDGKWVADDSGCALSPPAEGKESSSVIFAAVLGALFLALRGWHRRGTASSPSARTRAE